MRCYSGFFQTAAGSNRPRLAVLIIMVLMLGWTIPGTALANKSSVRLEVPETVAAGTAVTIVVHVRHEGNNFLHHTNWVSVAADGQEIQRWEFGFFDTPEKADFIRQTTYTPEKSVTISAEANCNLHGSEGGSRKTVTVVSPEEKP